jgi:SAM-dependent methyltransferase
MIPESKLIHVIPSAHPKPIMEATLSNYKGWFYEFTFSDGTSTQAPDPLTGIIHRTRAELIFPLLDEVFQCRWHEIRCLDVACHQGWFATQLALRGASKVLGIDVRNDHIEMASVIKYLSNMSNVTFTKRNLYEINPEEDGEYELTLFLGILYHLDNPLQALRVIRSVTKHLCVIESQVVRPVPELECLWGADATPRKGPGIAVVESDEHHVEGKRSVVLVPTLDALCQMLYAVGFNHLYLSVPPQSVYEQYGNFDRVVVFAQVW